jgi:uncharacterized OB-fold protein
MRQAAPVHVIAHVILNEGPTMMTNITQCDPDAVRIGAGVQVAFAPTAGSAAPPMVRLRAEQGAPT